MARDVARVFWGWVGVWLLVGPAVALADGGGITADKKWVIEPSGYVDVGPKTSRWCAVSVEAKAVTGDIQLSGKRIVFGNGAYVSMSRVGDLASWPSGFAYASAVKLPAPPVAPAELFKVDQPQQIDVNSGSPFFPSWLVVSVSGDFTGAGGARRLWILWYHQDARPTPDLAQNVFDGGADYVSCEGSDAGGG